MVTVYLARALICFAGACHPVLVGPTPTGTFSLHRYRVSTAGYGGDVEVFAQDAKTVWAIHRVWLGSPAEHRWQRLASGDARDRHVTRGCLNVMPDVYAQLVNCCAESDLRVEP